MDHSAPPPSTLKELFGLSLVSHAVNWSKGMTFPVLLCVMLFAGTYDKYGCMLYTTLHGMYGVFWCWKQLIFPDVGFMRVPTEMVNWYLGTDIPSNRVFNGALFLGLFGTTSSYWIGGIALLLDKNEPDLSPLKCCAAVALYTLGMFFHFPADIQKYERLKSQKGLIMDGYFAIVRSPGFLGEVLIYSSFFLLASSHMVPMLISFSTMAIGLPVFILGKEKSLARYPEYADYSKRVKLIFPFVL
jgi:3-oxo-5-alpha-steroid 4-dehydrogenase